MDLFTLTPTGALNQVSVAFNSTPDVTKGPDNIRGALGDIIKASADYASSHKVTGTVLYEGEYMLVRTLASSTAALAVGRPVFWSDKDNYIVTPDAVVNAEFAGIAINVPDNKGDCVLIVISGDAPGLFDAAMTKNPAAINDLVFLKIAGGVATLDVLADATALTTTNARLLIGRCPIIPTQGAVSRVRIMDFSRAMSFKEGVR